MLQSAEEIQKLYNGAGGEIKLEIHGGLGCTIFIDNKGNESITADYEITARGIIRHVDDSGHDIEIPAASSYIYKKLLLGFMTITATVEVNEVALTRYGFSLLGLVIFVN